MTRIRATTIASIFLNPTLVSNKRSNTSKTVINTAIINGISNNKYKAIAAPITSAISVAMIANSVKIQSTIPNALLVLARIAWAKSIWLTIPSLAAIYCNNMAIKLDSKITDINRY